MNTILTNPKALDYLELDQSMVKRAAKNLKEGTATLVVLSGKAGSGKDTAAPLVLDALGYTDRTHVFFAEPLKTEISNVITCIKESDSPEKAAHITAEHQGVFLPDAEFIVNTLWDDVMKGNVKTSYDRTVSSRIALQYWGTEIRRSQNEYYWVRQVIRNALELIADGVSAYGTDARFPNEIDAAIQSGGRGIRLDVSPEVQEARILARDGIMMTEEARQHSSETALDTYGGFHVRINVDNLSIPEVTTEICERISHGKH